MRLLILDGNSIMNRAYYGIRLLTNKNGEYTNAIFGFLNILLKLEDTCQPDCVAVAFDVHAPTFRHKMYDAYKAGRHAMPEELRQQMPAIKEVLHALGIKTLEQEGWEADDILGTFAKACRDHGDECYIATGDRDALQLAHGGVKVLLARGQSRTDVYDENVIMEEKGVTPEELIQVKALQGDSSDNIPGVQGIGEKTALKFIQKYHTVDYIYDHIDEIEAKPGERAKLKNDRDNAYLSLKLGEINTEAPVDTDLSLYQLGNVDMSAAVALFLRYELFSLLPRYGLDQNAAIAPAKAAEPEKPRELTRLTCVDADYLLKRVKGQDTYVYPCMVDGSITDLYFAFDDEIIVMPSETPEYAYFIREFFSDESSRKFSYNTKELHRLACQYGITLKGVCGDLLLSAYLLSPGDSKYDIAHLCMEYGVVLPPFSNALGEQEPTVSEASVLKPLFEIMNRRIDEAGEADLLNEIELPLSRVLAEMEYAGFEVDKEGIEAFGKTLGERIRALTEEIYDSVGYEFNINSPKQLGTALFDDLQLPYKKKKTANKGYSTNAEVLEGLVNDYPVVAQILEYRSLSKLKSTYCDGLLKVIEPDGRIHTRFNQVETRTGRISSLEPNLQNIPIRTALGREMRKFFIAGKGKKLVDVDYSQIELRVLADLADDQNMIDAFNSGDDIHAITASQVFNMPLELITPQLRSRAKAVNFGIVYGIGAFSLAKDIGVSNREAKQYIDNYLAHYSGVDDYMKRMISLAKDKGYSETLFHRKRYLPELTSSNHMMRAFGERVARNMPIQGTAADIIKIAMVKVDDRLKAEGMQSRLILQVHDELIVEAPEDEAEQALAIVTEEMQNACQMKVLLRADGSIGDSWYEAH